MNIIDLHEKLLKFEDIWSPKVITELNDYQIKLAKVQGEFVWHKHDDTDELFMVIKGQMDIHFRDGIRHLNEGQILVVPKGVEHKPVANNECHIMLIEPKGVVNTGNEISTLKAENDIWI